MFQSSVSIAEQTRVQRPKVDFFEETDSAVPYVTLASRVYYCQFDKDQKRRRKEENSKVCKHIFLN